MSQTAGPFGLLPVSKLGQVPDTGGLRTFAMTTNSANGIFTNDLVNITGGQPSRITATPTTTLGTATPVGTAAKVQYTDPTGLSYDAPYLPANAITNGYTNVLVSVYDDPNQLFRVQADGTVALSNIGKNAALNGFTAPTGNGNYVSLVSLASATIATTNTLAVRIVDVETPNDPYSEVIVKFNVGVHAYAQGTGQ